ncbi:Choline/ethanolaminephosphotransferase 2, partial [Camellia lanceoleosa]
IYSPAPGFQFLLDGSFLTWVASLLISANDCSLVEKLFPQPIHRDGNCSKLTKFQAISINNSYSARLSINGLTEESDADIFVPFLYRYQLVLIGGLKPFGKVSAISGAGFQIDKWDYLSPYDLIGNYPHLIYSGNWIRIWVPCVFILPSLSHCKCSHARLNDGVPLVDERWVLLLYCVYTGSLYLHFAVSVIHEITTALGIYCFRVTRKEA